MQIESKEIFPCNFVQKNKNQITVRKNVFLSETFNEVVTYNEWLAWKES